MTILADTLRAAGEELTRAGKSFALVGGFAVSVRTEPRFTRDVDLAVAVSDDAEAERLVNDLVSRDWRLHALVEHDALGRLATARLSRPDADVLLDLLFASSGIEPEIVADAETLEVVPGLYLPVAAVGHLLAVKLLARTDARPQDDADIQALKEVADSREWERAREAVAAIVARGYARGRDLSAALEDLTPPSTRRIPERRQK